MSQKWRRSQAWDDEAFPRWAAPVKFLVRAFSSIWLAVIWLTFVALYGVLASVPIGLLVSGVTWAFYALTLLATMGLIAVPLILAVRASKAAGGLRFVLFFKSVVLGLCVGTVGWVAIAWPMLRHDPSAGTGVMFFADFVKANSATTVRRLPGLEMSELEFYSWWPLRIVLLCFVVNMVTATLRRIEFVFPNLGVLTVHSGIVLIALGSIYYSGQKLEGDVLLRAGTPRASGELTPGAFASAFYDNTDVVLYVRQGGNWEQRPLRGIPRYNDYGLALAPGESAWEASGQVRPWDEWPDRSLERRVPESPLGLIDPDVAFRVVGYASYAEAEEDWIRAALPVGGVARPLRHVEFLTTRPHPDGTVDPDKPVFVFSLLPTIPAHRVIAPPDSPIGIEYTTGMSAERFADLTEPLPVGSRHGLVVEVPGLEGEAPFRAVFDASAPGELVVGETGYSIRVAEIAPEPPLAIITEGYRGSTSSVAIVEITPPEGEPFTRYVYHRFPEINQEMAGVGPDGRPLRRDPDPGIRVAYIDASKMLQLYFDESDGVTRAIVRTDDGQVRVIPRLDGDLLPDAVAELSFRVSTRWEHVEPYSRPMVVPDIDRDRESIGTHREAMLGVEITADRAPTDPEPGQWSTIVWVPFSQYLNIDTSRERRVDLPDGRWVTLAFGRRQHQLPGFEISLVDFEMISYDHRGAPRDYQSTLRVVPSGREFEEYTHIAKLNAPLRAPFHWDPEGNYFSNLVGRLSTGLSPRQFKFSQAGWDQGTWAQTQQMVDRGELEQPFVRFTILQVGNNPGIHVIAAGGILMGLGIPWAFYVKPMIMKRRKQRIQEAVARGEYTRPSRDAEPAPETPAEVTA